MLLSLLVSAVLVVFGCVDGVDDVGGVGGVGEAAAIACSFPFS